LYKNKEGNTVELYKMYQRKKDMNSSPCIDPDCECPVKFYVKV